MLYEAHMHVLSWETQPKTKMSRGLRTASAAHTQTVIQYGLSTALWVDGANVLSSSHIYTTIVSLSSASNNGNLFSLTLFILFYLFLALSLSLNKILSAELYSNMFSCETSETSENQNKYKLPDLQLVSRQKTTRAMLK